MTESLARRLSYRVFRRRQFTPTEARELVGLMTYRPERCDGATARQVCAEALVFAIKAHLIRVAVWRDYLDAHPDAAARMESAV